MQLLLWKITEDLCHINEMFLFFFVQDGRFPDAVRLMTGVQWLKLDKTNLTQIPEELGKLLKLVSSF
jgi:hypothetical protein